MPPFHESGTLTFIWAELLCVLLQVISSPQESPLPAVSEVRAVASDQNLSWDPRSPTPGVSRTPMKAIVSGK